MNPPARTLARWLLETPLIWAVAGFAIYFHYAHFIPLIAWNAIELIIAEHVIDHGRYVTSLDYASALTWRPVLPTMLVAFLRLWTADPLLIYQIFCGTALGCLAASLFLSARLLWGTASGHIAALFTLTCPGITTLLIDHFHSYSHLGALLLLGPTLYVALLLLRDPAPSPRAAPGLYVLSGILWGLLYLCRGELPLFVSVHFLALAWRHLRQRRPWRWLAGYAGAFLVFFLSYNLAADHAARRDGLLIRKSIYGFYISQGWVDPGPDAKADTEASGYIYALKLYGDPVENGESLLRAIRRNPAAFGHRLALNLRTFYARYANPDFFNPACASAVLFAVLCLVTGLVPRAQRTPFWFLLGLFAASHFVLVYHIDPRYLTVGIPPLLLLAAGAAGQVFRWLGALSRRNAAVLGAVVLLAAAASACGQVARVRAHGPGPWINDQAMRSLGNRFRAVVRQPHLAGNREPHIGFVLPANSMLHPEDGPLLAYYSHTAWVTRGAEGIFPRGKFYSFRECDDDYRFVPAEQLAAETANPSVKVIDDYQNDVLGRYYLLQMNP
ncbi:MAG TPA: hypothetical protein VG838_15920 [Opitutaceae bacterium]|nr:hypothetical protein [Opitutaceae bacterium]